MFYPDNVSVDGTFTEWSDWSACSQTCGRGSAERNRTCVGPFFGGQDCEGSAHETKYCYPSSCPGMVMSVHVFPFTPV